MYGNNSNGDIIQFIRVGLISREQKERQLQVSIRNNTSYHKREATQQNTIRSRDNTERANKCIK